MRPVLACAVSDAHVSAHETSKIKPLPIQKSLPAFAQDDSDFKKFQASQDADNSAPDDSEEDSPSDLSLDDIASLAYEFHFSLDSAHIFSSEDDDVPSHVVDPCLKPPHTHLVS